MRHGRNPISRTSRTTKEACAGCSKRPSSKAAASEEARRTLRYVELLSEVRTPLADFFSILPILHLHYANEPGIEEGLTTDLFVLRVLRFILENSIDECAVA